MHLAAINFLKLVPKDQILTHIPNTTTTPTHAQGNPNCSTRTPPIVGPIKALSEENKGEILNFLESLQQMQGLGIVFHRFIHIHVAI